MLQVPLSMHPIHIFGVRALDTEYKCNGCGKTFDLEDMVVYQDYFLDSEKNLHYGWLSFCDTLCILEHWSHKGEA